MGLKSDLEGLTESLVEKEERLRDLEGRLGSKVGVGEMRHARYILGKYI